MTNLFKKAVVFTDLHFGLKTNSQTHNDDCLDFIKWMISLSKEHGCETCLFLGDWNNNRANINILTLNYSIKAIELLSTAFEKIYFIPGNHDQFFRDKRDIQSVEWAKFIPNITIINDFFKEDNVSIVPWLVKDDHKKIEHIRAKYCFGHFELPHFYMNQSILMPDHNEIRREHFHRIGTVYSGHFHRRQTQKNITYIGNCFPHNFSDAGDDERGCMILEWDKPHQFYTWPDQPTYRIFKLSELLLQNSLLKPRMYVKAIIDIELSYEEATEVKTQFTDKFGLRDFSLIPKKSDNSENNETIQVAFQSTDQIVSESIKTIEAGKYDPLTLLSIYNQL
jgi:DNA repair exonuclease SbcCD nuclease subunit